MSNSARRVIEALVPATVLATIVAVDVASAVVISGSFAIAAVVAAAISSVAVTVAVAVLATTLAALSGVWNDNVGTAPWAVRLALAALLSGIAVASAVLRRRRERRLTRMTVIAEGAQRALLRTLPSTIGTVELSAQYLSATEDALVGGDLYEVADTPFGVRAIVGDVRGKGIGAVQLTATVLAAFRHAAFTAPSTGCVAAELDTALGNVAGDEDFVTAVIAEFHDDGTVTLVNCGHPAPLLVLGASSLREVDTGVPQVPLGMGTPGRASTILLPPGARLLLYTDGLVESRSPRGEYFPLHLQADVLAAEPLDAALDRLVERLRRHVENRLRDDVAMVLVRSRPAE
jgi:serine phosphatase RsbU (regulator of sigma subunit)